MRRAASLIALSLVAVVALSAAACSRAAPGTPPSGPRVVSLSPSTTEALFAIGAGPSVVGRSRYCDFPAEVRALPEVGGYVDPSFEAIFGLSPTLVTGARGPAGAAVAERITARRIDAYFPPTESFAEIDAMILGLGARTGRQDEAARVVDAIHARTEAIERAVKDLPAVRVLFVFGLEPVVAAGPDGYAAEMLRRAGGANVITSGAYPTLDVEKVVELAPDVVLDATMGEQRVARIRPDRPGWSSVRAVREGRVVRLDDEAVIRPGPRVAEGLARLARALHPSAQIP